MIKVDRLIIVEGKYDKIKLESVVDGFIITTDGFSVFKDKQKSDFIRRTARERGILILTDGDAAGFKIRNYLNTLVPDEYIINAYIPDVLGKEKRKKSSSGEGKLGVEGMSGRVLVEALKKAGVENAAKTVENHTSAYDLYALGVTGQSDSKARRKKLIKALGLPERISANNLLKYINSSLTRQEFDEIVEKVERNV